VQEKKLLEQQVKLRTTEVVQQKEEIAIQRDNLEKALQELKSAQNQLVQREKMASLGELTSGIAHEIKNPMNFVNNFAEVTGELVKEMNDHIDKGQTQEIKTIATDIKQNLDKIAHYGKLADAIVQGMLQHSGSGTGRKEPTNLNAITDEYLRLCYNRLKAKEKSFYSRLQTDYDDNIGAIDIIPEDIGKVLLNIIGNSFYAVSEKRKQQGDAYEPVVSVSTALIPSPGGGEIEIRVSDNGTGIPQKFLNKIFQPFFTTKPTGQGTGLGLSLSYDIITQGHDGQIKVETKEGEFTEFIISIPN
jgi:signal transduction histidine kinase